MRKLIVPSFALLFAACSAEKPDVTESFDELAGLDEKSDAFSGKMKIVGSLDYNQTSARVSYTSTPRFRAFKFAGHEGDAIEVFVRSDDGDPITWVLDNSYHVVAKNDDATKNTTDSHIKVTLPAHASATHYIVFRDYDVRPGHFTVELKGPAADFFACNRDPDCIAVPRVACCNNGYKEAVNINQIDAYENSFTCPQENPICPLFIINDTRQAECNVATHKCEMVAIDQIKCGGHTINPHMCPQGYDCVGKQMQFDAPGSCAPSPKDECGGCKVGQTCSYCWGHFACIPEGALC